MPSKKIKYFFMYTGSYFLFSLVSISINEIFNIPPGVSPNIFVQILCVAFFIKNIPITQPLSLRQKISLPILFSMVAIAFFIVMTVIFKDWKEQHGAITPLIIINIFAFNYIVSLATTLYVSNSKNH